MSYIQLNRINANKNENFNEFYLMVINAITSNLLISVETTKCSGNRNITSHGYIENKQK